MNGQTAKLTCEFIGTFALTFIGAASILTTTWTGGSPGLVGIALAHGLVLAMIVTATMNISGGHINPAITVVMFVTGRIKPAGAAAYIVAQCLGATVAGLLLAMIFGGLGDAGQAMTGSAAIQACALGTPNFGAAITPGMALVVEIILTFLLGFAIFGTAVDDRAPALGGMLIGLTVAVDILAGGPITGAAMNPARTIGTLIGGGSATAHLWAQHWVYWAGPIIGAVMAGLVYDKLIMAKK